MIETYLFCLQGTSNTGGIALEFGKEDLTDLRTEAFSAMSELRLLHVTNVNFVGDFACIPNRLKWLKWKACPFESLPCELNLPEVVVLDLTFGMMNEVWNQNMSTIKVHIVKIQFFYIRGIIASIFLLCFTPYNSSYQIFPLLTGL